MNKIILATATMPWAVIAVVLLWALCGFIYLSDRRALAVLLKKCTTEKFNNTELITNFKKFFKFHPFSLHKTDLTVKMIPALVTEGQSAMNWVRKINGKDITVPFSQSLLFAYFVLYEKGYNNELNLLKKKTHACFSDDDEFNRIKDCIFDGEKISADEIETLNGKYSKGIACYYASCVAYKNGDMDIGNEYAHKAMCIVPEKLMYDLAHERISQYEEAN